MKTTETFGAAFSVRSRTDLPASERVLVDHAFDTPAM